MAACKSQRKGTRRIECVICDILVENDVKPVRFSFVVFAVSVDQSSSSIYKLPVAEHRYGSAASKIEMNAVHSNADLAQVVAKKPRYWQICWNSVHTKWFP